MNALSRTLVRLIAGTALAGAMLVTTGAHARTRTQISPYLEFDQTVVGDIKGGNGDVLTYSSVAVGLDMSVQTSRAEAQVDVRYEHQFAWNRGQADSDTISGIAQGRYQIMRDTLQVEAGAIGTRVRTDGLSGANSTLVGGSNTSDVYSFYAGPTLTTHVGELAVNAAYRLGYTRVEDDVSVSVPGGAALDSFDDSLFHSVSASVGMQPGTLPFGWSVGAGYDREDMSQLDQRYEGKWGRADVTVPVTATLAVVGGVGYEAIEISQRSPLLNTNGTPVIGGNGRFVTDPASPRQLSYDDDGIIWDVGVLWRPSRRTTLELRAGERYGSMHYVGSFGWQPDEDTSVNIAYFDTIDSFGRSIVNGVSSLSGGFEARRNPFSGDLTGCVAGDQGGACLNTALAGITSANYRNRGLVAQYRQQRGRWNWGMGAVYSQRKFIAPNTPVFALLDRAKDENYFADLYIGRQFEDESALQATVYGNQFSADVTGLDNTNYGGYLTYSRLFGRRLSANASVGIDTIDPQDSEAVTSALGQVGLRYQF